MCGLFGYVGDGGFPPPSLETLADSLRHRGPEGEGHAAGPGWGIGATRLRVTDPRAIADRPARSEDGRYVAVLNGEIFNHHELRGDLARRGHRFETECDTEVLPHLFEEWGPCFVERLRGPFALAVIDTSARRVLLARDRLGEKPLVFVRRRGGVCFASEWPALVRSGASEGRLAEGDLVSYLREGFIRSPRTGIEDIERLSAGRWAVFDALGGQCERYASASPTGSEKEEVLPQEEVLPMLRDAVVEQVRADRPVGVWLSGGVDSGLVAAFARETYGPGLPAFTLGIGDPRFDETALAEETARHLGLDHHVVSLPTPSPESTECLLLRMGEPLADTSAFAIDALAQATREHVVVALSGDGGDELFFGYRRLAALRWHRTLRRWIRLRRDVGNQTLERRASSFARRFWEGLALDEADALAYWRSVFWGDDIRELGGRDEVERPRAREFRDPRLDEIEGPLAEGLLVKVDRLSMAHALEVRCPFLDHRLVQRVLGIDVAKAGPRPKALLRSLAASKLPRRVVRGAKHGFGAPVGDWLRGPLLAWSRASLLEEGRFARSSRVRVLWDEHVTGVREHGARLWALLVWSAFERRLATLRSRAGRAA